MSAKRIDNGGNQVPDDWRECWACGGAGLVPGQPGDHPRFRCGPCRCLGFIPPTQAGPPTAEQAADMKAWIERVRAETNEKKT